MRGLERRLEALEGRSSANPYEHLTDEELAARIAAIDLLLESAGVVFPDDFDAMSIHQQKAYLAQLQAELPV